MLGEVEKKVLEYINFSERYIKAREEFQYDVEVAFKLSKKEILKLLKQQGLPFVAKGENIFFADVQKGDYTFRLVFDINKSLIPLTYIYILINGEFITNGLGNLGKMLALNGISLNKNFGLNSTLDFNNYISKMQSIFLDFVEQYMKMIVDESTSDNISYPPAGS